MEKDNSKKNIEEEVKEEKNIENNEEIKEAVVKPRKRKIGKNIQMPMTILIFLAIFITMFVWKNFYNNSIVGKWNYINNGSYVETFDAPSETEDAPADVEHKYTQRVCYEFKDNGECVVTLGTMSVKGDYNLYTVDDGANMLTASVVYNYTPILYGSYEYKIEGNNFSGRKLIILPSKQDGEISSSENEHIELSEGEGENPLKVSENFKGDDRLVGTWRNDAKGLEYKFTADGYFTRTGDDGFTIEHTYNLISDGVFMATCYGDDKQNYSYVYSFDADNNLSINGEQLTKVK